MTHPRPDTVAIQRLTLRLHPGMSPGINSYPAARAQVGQVQQELAWADWPEAPGDSWVFIRRLQVRATRSQLTRQVLEQARQQVQGGSGDEVVRFASLTDLLAALLVDIRQGVAAQRWYWQQWAPLFALPVPVALVRLLAEHAEQLNAVCARLAQQRQLAMVWQALDEAGAYQLAQELAWRSGCALPDVAPPLAPGSTDTVGAIRLPSRLLQRWGPVLATFRLSDPRHRLGLLLIAGESAPLALQRAPAQTLAVLAAQVGGIAPDGHPVLPGVTPPPPRAATRTSAEPVTVATDQFPFKSRDAAEAGAHSRQESTIPAASPALPHRPASARPESSTIPESTRAANTDDPATALAPAGSAGPAAHPPATPLAATTPATAAGLLASHLATSVPAQAAAQGSPVDPATDFARFTTTQGGLLYLLNFLNRPEVQSLLGDFWDTLPSGWGWLARLGQELALDLTDPLADYLATQLGLTDGTALATLPPLPARTELLTLAQRWYGRAGLWTPALLRLDAHIQATPSHLDLYAPLNAVQLPLRLAGLDFNPGWLPWLGRVVTLHYGRDVPP